MCSERLKVLQLAHFFRLSSPPPLLHSPPTILILIVVVVVANVIVITAVISLDPSLLVAMVAPGVSPTVWANQVSALTSIYSAAAPDSPQQFLKNFSVVANLNLPLLQCSEYTLLVQVKM